MADFLDVLARNAKKTIEEGYYTVTVECKYKHHNLKRSILEFNRAPVVTEIKLASPTLGMILKNPDVERIASSMQRGGAAAISILTEPKHFKGSLTNFIKVRKKIKLPLLMKDIFLSNIQIDTASKIGADAILLIKPLFDRGYSECDVPDMIKYAHSKDIEVLLETHTEDEFSSALDTEADLIGINNRDLKTLNVDINTTKKILQKINSKGKVVISESGINTPSDIRFLHISGAQAFLVGSALMIANDIEGKVRELVMAL